MKATDLMIGDWVINANIPKQVLGVVGHKVLFLNGKTKMWYPIKACRPIPITEDILKKIGLEEYGHRGLGYQYWEPLDDKRSIFLEKMPQDDCWYGFVGSGLPDNLDCNEPDTVFKHYRYVNELQHAIKQCEIEKEVVL